MFDRQPESLSLHINAFFKFTSLTKTLCKRRLGLNFDVCQFANLLLGGSREHRREVVLIVGVHRCFVKVAHLDRLVLGRFIAANVILRCVHFVL